jgi:hypothetical protein
MADENPSPMCHVWANRREDLRWAHINGLAHRVSGDVKISSNEGEHDDG